MTEEEASKDSARVFAFEVYRVVSRALAIAKKEKGYVVEVSVSEADHSRLAWACRSMILGRSILVDFDTNTMAICGVPIRQKIGYDADTKPYVVYCLPSQKLPIVPMIPATD